MITEDKDLFIRHKLKEDDSNIDIVDVINPPNEEKMDLMVIYKKDSKQKFCAEQKIYIYKLGELINLSKDLDMNTGLSKGLSTSYWCNLCFMFKKTERLVTPCKSNSLKYLITVIVHFVISFNVELLQFWIPFLLELSENICSKL
uniref:Uncharacterized protein n=1 Tax=Strongyloides venezuelensis TaxID=75913 RepID=A0A0K0G5N9_STRVS